MLEGPAILGPREVMRHEDSHSTPGPQNQNLYFSKSPRGFAHTLHVGVNQEASKYVDPILESLTYLVLNGA